MCNSKSKVRCQKRRRSKCDELVRTYSPMQYRFCELLQSDESIKSFRCNVPLDDCELGETYTTDFVITKTDGELMIRECVYRKHLTKPLTVKLITASYDYWSRRGVMDWGLVIDSATGSGEDIAKQEVTL